MENVVSFRIVVVRSRIRVGDIHAIAAAYADGRCSWSYVAAAFVVRVGRRDIVDGVNIGPPGKRLANTGKRGLDLVLAWSGQYFWAEVLVPGFQHDVRDRFADLFHLRCVHCRPRALVVLVRRCVAACERNASSLGPAGLVVLDLVGVRRGVVVAQLYCVAAAQRIFWRTRCRLCRPRNVASRSR